jgi:kynurenine formamidase
LNVKKIIDLSLIVEEGIEMPFHTGRNEPFQKEVVKTHDSHQVYGTVVEMYLHVGTHIDAPLHFIRGGDSIDQLPLERLVGDAVALDLLQKQGKVPIEKADLEEAMDNLRKKGIENKPGDRILICTGHHEKHWGSLDYWKYSPYLTEEAAQWIVDQKFSAAGYDFMQDIPMDLQDPNARGPIHRIILGNGLYNIEYLTGLDRAAGKQVWLSAAPILFKGVEGSPARVYAIIED